MSEIPANRRRRGAAPLNRALVVASFAAVTAASAAVFANTLDSEPRPPAAKAGPVAAAPQPLKLQPNQERRSDPQQTTVRKSTPVPGIAHQHIYLVRTTLMALDDANRTGNYTVLRDRASTAFRQKNSAADLAQTFQGFRSNRVDLGLAALIDPQLLAPPKRPNAETLLLTGQIPLSPNALLFELGFVAEGGQWKLDQLSVGLAQAGQRPKS